MAFTISRRREAPPQEAAPQPKLKTVRYTDEQSQGWSHYEDVKLLQQHLSYRGYLLHEEDAKQLYRRLSYLYHPFKKDHFVFGAQWLVWGLMCKIVEQHAMDHLTVVD